VRAAKLPAAARGKRAWNTTCRRAARTAQRLLCVTAGDSPGLFSGFARDAKQRCAALLKAARVPRGRHPHRGLYHGAYALLSDASRSTVTA